MVTSSVDIESGSVSLFGSFVLDGRRAALTRGGASVALRPKTFALLSYFAAHPGRVLGKDEMLAAVWPGVVVNEESLSQCVRELRAALGDDGQALIKTVARRGYLFDAPVQLSAAPVTEVASPRRSRSSFGCAIAGAVLLAGLTLTVEPSDPLVGVDQAVKARRSIAVMPFSELGADVSGYLAEAITEELITDLSKLPDTLVVAQASATEVGARETDITRIGRELRVRHVLSGSVRRDGAAVRIHVQFASSDNGAVLWSEHFDYPNLGDWSWPRDIGTRIVRVVDGRMTTAAAGPSAPRKGKRLEPIDATLQGQQVLRNFVGLADLLRARAHFENALAIEPDSAVALTGLAQSYLSEKEAGLMLGIQGIVVAESAIARALALAPDYLPAQCLAGHVLRERGDLEGALRVYQKVVEANPSDAWSHARIGAMKLRLGRPEEVADHTDAAMRLSPFEPALISYSHFYSGAAEYYLGRERAAEERMRQAIAVGPSPAQLAALVWLTALNALHERPTEARQHAAQVLRLQPYWTIHLWRIATAPVYPGFQTARERFDKGLSEAGLPE